MRLRLPRRRVLVASLLVLLLGVAALALVVGLPLAQAAALDWRPGEEPGARLVLKGDLPVAEFSGNAAVRGAQQGRLVGEQAGRLVKLMAIQPKLLLHRRSAAFQATLAAIAADDRAEIAALAATAGLDADDLLAANALVDTQCSALVSAPTATAPLLVARNMDFFPAKVLGPGTLVSVVRGVGPRAYANLGWPGGIGVVSGMNDRGLVACILLNHKGPDLPGAEPLQLRLRAILANEADLAGAVRRFAAAPVASSHYVLLADAAGACVVWQERDGLHRDDLAGGWLAASNGPRTGGQPQDDRGRCLRALAAAPPPAGADEAWMRQALTASYMPSINAQAMLFIPARREIQLARGTGLHPAARQGYLGLALGPLFDGAGVDTLTPASLPAPVPLRHYTDGGEGAQASGGG